MFGLVLFPVNDRELLKLLEEVSELIKPAFNKISLVVISSYFSIHG